MLEYWKMMLLCQRARTIGMFLLVVVLAVLLSWFASQKFERYELEQRAQHVCQGYCRGVNQEFKSGTPLRSTSQIDCRCGEPIEYEECSSP